MRDTSGVDRDRYILVARLIPLPLCLLLALTTFTQKPRESWLCATRIIALHHVLLHLSDLTFAIHCQIARICGATASYATHASVGTNPAPVRES
jgi:hypothetical protein